MRHWFAENSWCFFSTIKKTAKINVFVSFCQGQASKMIDFGNIFFSFCSEFGINVVKNDAFGPKKSGQCPP